LVLFLPVNSLFFFEEFASKQSIWKSLPEKLQSLSAPTSAFGFRVKAKNGNNQSIFRVASRSQMLHLY
jgi:hypothetical protein